MEGREEKISEVLGQMSTFMVGNTQENDFSRK